MNFKSILKTNLTLIFAIICLLQGNSYAQEKYKPEFSRPLKVGDTYKFESEFSENQWQKAVMPGMQTVDTSMLKKYNLVAKAKVLEVDGVGKELKKECNVESFTSTEGAEQKEILSAGKIIIATFGEQKISFEVLEKDSSNKIETTSVEYKILSELVKSNGGIGKVEQMSLDKPRKIGEKWNLSKSMIDEFAGSMKASLDVKDLKGFIQLTEKVSVNGFECLHYIITIVSKKIGAPGLSVKKGSLTVTMDIFLPIKETKPPVQSTMKVEVLISGFVAAQKGSSFDMNYTINNISKLQF